MQNSLAIKKTENESKGASNPEASMLEDNRSLLSSISIARVKDLFRCPRAWIAQVYQYLAAISRAVLSFVLSASAFLVSDALNSKFAKSQSTVNGRDRGLVSDSGPSRAQEGS